MACRMKRAYRDGVVFFIWSDNLQIIGNVESKIKMTNTKLCVKRHAFRLPILSGVAGIALIAWNCQPEKRVNQDPPHSPVEASVEPTVDSYATPDYGAPEPEVKADGTEEEHKIEIKTAYGSIMIGISEQLNPVISSEEAEKIIQKRADATILYLKNRDFENLAEVAHPEIGIRFSPYAEIRQEQVVLLPEIVENTLMDTTAYTWGIYDGITRPIKSSFKRYFERFVFDRDFSAADTVTYNRIIGIGATWDNVLEFYYRDITVEYHFYATEEAPMDWTSLRLVFSEYNGQRYLVAISHNEWTT